MVRVYTLADCSYCKSFIENFKATGVSYEEISADRGGVFIDKLEDTLNTSYYPIVGIGGGPDPVYVVSDNSKRPITVPSNLYIKYYQSVPHLITIILKTI